MRDNFTLQIAPLPYYLKYSAHDYAFCSLEFHIVKNGEKHCFKSYCSNSEVDELISVMSDYLHGKRCQNRLLTYYVPYIPGKRSAHSCSFETDITENEWLFRYKVDGNGEKNDFVFKLNKDDIVSLHAMLTEQSAAFEWSAQGKAKLYTIERTDKEFEWCYSAKAMSEKLSALCVGKRITGVYVSALNYSGPLRIRDNYVNYYLNPEVLIRTDDILIDLLIYAHGLFKIRVFDPSEYTVSKPTVDFYSSGDELCDLGNAYGAFRAEYLNIEIVKVTVIETEYYPYRPDSFDKSMVAESDGLPDTVIIHLSNDHTLSLHAWDDDFAIKLLPNRSGECDVSYV